MKYQNCFYSEDSFLLDRKVLEESLKLTKNNITEYNLFSYDLAENSFSDFCEQISTESFFSDDRVVILSGVESLKSPDKMLLNLFENYLKKESSSISLIIKLKEKIKKDDSLMSKLIIKYVKINEIKNPDEKEYLNEVYKDSLKDGYEIKKEDIEYLFLKVNKSYARLFNELEKLKLYKLNDKKIKEEDINLLVSDDIDSNIFEVTNYLLEDDKENLIKVYNNLLLKNIKHTQIMSLIFKRLYQLSICKILKNKKRGNDYIQSYLQVSQGQLYYLLNDLKKINSQRLDEMIIALARVDHMIKSGQVDPNYALELFLIRS